MNFRERAGLVATVSSALSRGEHTLTVLPDLLKQLLEEGVWREFETKTGKHVKYERFEDFVVTPPLSGLGMSMEFVRRIAEADPNTLDLLEQTLQNSTANVTRVNGSQKKSEISLPPEPSHRTKQDRTDKIMHRLSTEFPELHKQVLQGEKTIHAAAVEAKIAPARIAIRLTDPHSAAKTLLSHASPEFLEELRRLLDC